MIYATFYFFFLFCFVFIINGVKNKTFYKNINKNGILFIYEVVIINDFISLSTQIICFINSLIWIELDCLSFKLTMKEYKYVTEKGAHGENILNL